MGGEHCKQKKQHVQRPSGRTFWYLYWLRSSLVAQQVKDLVLGRCCGSGLIHGLGTSTCLRHGQKKKKKKKKKIVLAKEIQNVWCPGGKQNLN